MVRKVIVFWNWQRCMWFADFLQLLSTHGFQKTYTHRHPGYAIGWVPEENIETIRALPEVHSIHDDYPFLVQEETK